MVTFGDNLPRNFSWLEVNVLAGSCCPDSELQLRSLSGIGIRHIITLSAESCPPLCAVKGLTMHRILLRDGGAATEQQFQQFFHVIGDAMRSKESVLVHCRSGRGRTGMLLAAFLMKYRQYGADDAIAEVRSRRRGSIETRAQEEALKLLQNLL
eukprot:TRINITY_DN21089_c0_g1_i1.p1 TRINITY_DN21089_c0_g1~~TRINITY_DN21089_c0_g1_i1.p1  ORF type:complete len:154 (+),score=14.87 TRINITY_DN21089_c0_g1_i1:948-1409(+)